MEKRDYNWNGLSALFSL